MRRLKPASASGSGVGGEVRYPRYRSFWTSLGVVLSVGPAAVFADASVPQPTTEKKPSTRDSREYPEPMPQRVPVHMQPPGGMPVPHPPQPPQPQPQPRPQVLPRLPRVRTGGVKPSVKQPEPCPTPPTPTIMAPLLGALHPHAPDEPCFVGGQVLVTLRMAHRGDGEV